MKLVMKKSAYALMVVGFSFFAAAMERPVALNPELQKKFFAAVENGDLKEVNRLMRFRPQLDINAKNEYGQTPIERAIIGEQPDIVYALLNAGIDPNQRSKGGLKPGDTLLMLAASVGNVEIVQMLLDFGADPWLREEELSGRLGKTAFDLSWRYPAVQKLLKHHENADINVVDTLNQTPLIRSIAISEPEIANLLIENGADVNKRNLWGNTALSIASAGSIVDERARILVVKKLIAAGANIDNKNELGATPLMYAVEYNNPDIVKLLLDAGANPNLIDDEGDTAYDIAKNKGYHRIMQMLEPYQKQKLQ